MTARELRQMLTNVYDQQMTVKELRELLFRVYDQDEAMEPSELTRITYDK